MKTYWQVLFGVLLFSPVYVLAQEGPVKLVELVPRIWALDELGAGWVERMEASAQQAQEFARANELMTEFVDADGEMHVLVGMCDEETPVYFTPENVKAAKAIQTDKVQSASGYHLTGKGVTVGVWEGEGVDASHVQFQRNSPQPNAVTMKKGAQYACTAGGHATHVAGTIVSAGKPPGQNSRGMAPDARVHAYCIYDKSSSVPVLKVLSDIKDEVVQNDLRLVNGSFNFRLEWCFSPVCLMSNMPAKFEQKKLAHFGLYSKEFTRPYDELTYNAPYLLMVHAAGNHTGKRPDNSSWDTMFSVAVAKNVLTIGNVETTTPPHKLASDSAVGPVDDGRIKPDVVAFGQGVYSTLPNDGYGPKQGTSMATPAVTGSLALLLEQWNNTVAAPWPLASTWKALLIHTADDVGNPGPDYMHGWGIVNTERAADFIAGNPWVYQIFEQELEDKDTYTFYVTKPYGKDVKVTIAWTDPPGDAQPMLPADVRTARLKNDIDLRISHQGNTWMPFVLDPDNPNANAQQGDNDRDNVEQVIVPNSAPGVYKVTISVDGSLTTKSQVVSVVAESTYVIDLPGLLFEPPLLSHDLPLLPWEFELREFWINPPDDPRPRDMLIDVEIDHPELLEASVFYRYPNEGGLLLLRAQGQPGTTGVNIKQAMLIEDDWLEVDNRFTVDILR